MELRVFSSPRVKKKRYVIRKTATKGINMINRFYISVLAATFALSATCGASALEISNGLSVNGRDATGAFPVSMQLQAAILQDGTLISLGQ